MEKEKMFPLSNKEDQGEKLRKLRKRVRDWNKTPRKENRLCLKFILKDKIGKREKLNRSMLSIRK